MFKSIIRIIGRNLRKHRSFTTINILGLTIGFSAFILISLFIKYEFSWDKHNINYDRIYRVQQVINNQGDIWTQVPAAFPSAIKNKFPEIEQSILFRETWGGYLSKNNVTQFSENNGIYADQDFLSVFTIHFLEGNAQTALTEPNSIVLSKKTAEKLFGNESALGKSVFLDKVNPLKVTGIIKELPKNSHISISYIISLNSFENIQGWKGFRDNWGSNSFRCYILVKPGANIAALNKKIANVYKDNNQETEFKPYLQSLSKLYLNPVGRNDYMVAIVIYCIIAAFILILASINYINHTTAHTAVRAKEIAIRKVNGSSRSVLVVQLLAESVVTSLIAIVISIALVSMIIPLFNRMIDRDIVLFYPGAGSYFIFLFGLAVMIGLLSGIYPALFMTSVKSVALLKGEVFKITHVKGGLKKVLVTFQFVISIVLVINTIFMSRQINYTMNKDLGFKQHNLLFTAFKTVKDTLAFTDIKSRFAQYPEITEVTISRNIPFYGSDGKLLTWEGSQTDEKEDVRYNQVDYNYGKTLGLTIIKGRDFSPDLAGDAGKACIINETAMKRFGWKDPIGKTVDNNWHVIGVVKDFHLYSIHEKIPPLLLDASTYTKTAGWFVLSFRIKNGFLKKSKKIISSELESLLPNEPFDVKEFDSFYKTDSTFKTYYEIRSTFLFFAIITIFLTIFGLLGLVSYTIQRRTKEIGVRKIIGSSVAEIFVMLNKEYSLLILVASALAVPLALYAYHKLPFAYVYGMSGMEFILAAGALFIISLLTTGYYTIKAAMRNPVEALRYE